MSDQQPSYQSGKSKLTLRVRLILATVIILVYGAACCLPALVFSRYYPGDDSPPATDVISSGLTLLLSLDTFRLFLIEWPGDEGGVARASLQTLQPGAWLWLASIGVTFVSAWILLLAPRSVLPPVPSELTTN